MSKTSNSRTIDISGITPVEQWFHNEKIPVYQTVVSFDQVTFWPENSRTELDFELLSDQKKKPIAKLTVEEITEYLTQQKLKLADLAKSIQRNGVRVPLIVLDDGTLLDGNRRFFACAYLKQRAAEKKLAWPPVLDRIPVWVIKTADIDKRKRTKILAEMNFVTDLKMDWPLSVKARLVYELYQRCLKDGNDENAAYDEAKEMYAVDTGTAKAYIETVDLTTKFVKSGRITLRDSYRQIVQEKFVYFWEFRDKGMSGSKALHKTKELPKVRKLFFKMVANNRFSNMKQVEPLVWAYHHDYEWELLESSGGSKIDQVEALFKGAKAIRSAEDKIRSFHRWLQNVDWSTLTQGARDSLKDVKKLCQDILNS